MKSYKEKREELYKRFNNGHDPKDHIWLAEELRRLDAEEAEQKK
jgi:hypothetical protein